MTQDPQTLVEPIEEVSPSGSHSTPSANVEGLSPSGTAESISLPWSLIGAIVFFSAILSVSLLLVAGKVVPGVAPHSNIVTFDAIRFTNAQRAIASKFMLKDVGSDPVLSEQAIVLNQSSTVETVVREIAGRNTLVLVKQAVVDSQYPDITDAVLNRLGLPTNVPSVLPNLSEFTYNPGPGSSGPGGSTRNKEGVLP